MFGVCNFKVDWCHMRKDLVRQHPSTLAWPGMIFC